MSRCISLAVSWSLVFASVELAGDTYTVDASLSASNHAMKEYKTFKDLRELATLGGGDTVEVVYGTYAEAVDICKGDPTRATISGCDDSGSTNNYLTIVGLAGPG